MDSQRRQGGVQMVIFNSCGSSDLLVLPSSPREAQEQAELSKHRAERP